METTHQIKVDVEYFASVLDGSKPFDVRLNDRAYQRGDLLHLVEHGRPGSCETPDCHQQCRPRSVHKLITFVYAGDPRYRGHGGLQPGWVVLGLGDTDDPLSAAVAIGALE